MRMPNQSLIDFIKQARSKGYQDDLIRRSILDKGWPLEEVNVAFNILKTTQEFTPYTIPIQKPIQEPKKEVQEKKKTSSKEILKWASAGLGILLLLTFTFLVFFYMNALMDYAVVDSATQQESTNRCLNPDCSDLKEYALSAMKEKALLASIMSLITTITILAVYKLIKFKKTFIWILNIIYFFVLAIFFYLWLTFSK